MMAVLVVFVTVFLDVAADGTIKEAELVVLVVVVDAKALVITSIMGGLDSGKIKTATKKVQLPIDICWIIEYHK